MKNLVVVVIGLLVFIGCSKSFKNVEPEDPIDQEFHSNVMRTFDISPSDTAGLRIFGYAEINKEPILLGNKNGLLWVQLLENQADTFKRKNNFTINADFNDRVEIDLGYGEKKVIEVHYVDWNSIIKNIGEDIGYYDIKFHDYKHFLLHHPDGFSWIICENEIFERENYFQDIFANGYIGVYDDSYYVFDETGEPLYEYKEEFKNYTFITLYEYIKYSDYSITRQNGETGKIIWEVQFEKMGQVIDGHEPKIEHLMEIADDIISCTFNITNYDGSKETKNFKVNIDTGQVTKL